MIDKYLNKIINADCLELLKELPDKSVDCILTDPPYGMNFVSNNRSQKYSKIENDNSLDWLPDLLKELKRISKDDAIWYIFCSWHHIDIFKQEIEKIKKIKDIMIWDKMNGGQGDLKCSFAPRYENIIFCNDNKQIIGKRIYNILSFGKTGNVMHPTQKPVDLFATLISKATQKGELVLDCFSGSGTTAIACHRLKRNFICVEKDVEYYNKSLARLEEERKQGSLF